MEKEEEEVAAESEEAAAHSKRRKGNAGCLRAESYHFAVTSDKQTHTDAHRHTLRHTHVDTHTLTLAELTYQAAAQSPPLECAN